MITSEKHEFTYILTIDIKIGVAKVDVSGPYLVNGRVDSVRAGRAAILRLAALVEELSPTSEVWDVRILQPDPEKNLSARMRVGGFRGTIAINIPDGTRSPGSIERAGEVMQKALTLIEGDSDRKVIEAAQGWRTGRTEGRELARVIDERTALLKKVG